MHKKNSTILLFLTLCLPLACERNTEPPPPSVTGSEGALRPVTLSDELHDETMLGKAAEESAIKLDLNVADDADRATTMDTSTPQAAIESYVAAFQKGRLDALPDMVIPEQQEKAQAMVDIMGPLFEAFSRLEKAVSEKIPDAQMDNLQGNIPGQSNLEIVSVDDINDQEAMAILRDTKEDQTQEVQLRLIDGQWRINDPRLEMVQMDQVDMMRDMFAPMAENMSKVAQRVEDGQITTQEQLMQAMMAIMPMGGNN